jgi:hypothetical protein
MIRYCVLLFCWLVASSTRGEDAHSSVWISVDESAAVFLSAVDVFTNTPTEALLQTAKEKLQVVALAWEEAKPHQNPVMIEQGDARSVDSGEVGKADLNDLIGASRCPVPFSRDMIRKLNVDMQGIGVLNYLLSETPEGATNALALVTLYQTQPRRSAYLASTAALLKEKTAAFLAASP